MKTVASICTGGMMERFNKIKSKLKRSTPLGSIYTSFRNTALGDRIAKAKARRYQKKAATHNRKMLSLHGEETSALFYRTLTEAGLEVFVSFGSLLGLVRDGHFIPYDDDLDFCLLYKSPADWEVADTALKRAGFRLTRQFSLNGVVTEHAYRYKDLQVDLFAMVIDGNQSVYYLYRQDADKTYSNDFQRTAYEGRIHEVTTIKEVDFGFGVLSVPSNPELFLEDVYGIDWRTPIAGFDSYTGPAMSRLGDFGERAF